MNVTDDKLLTFKDLAMAVEEKYGIRLHVSTLHRWRAGLRGKKLLAIRLGGRWYARVSDVLLLSNETPAVVESNNARSRRAKARDGLKSEFGC